MKVENKIEIFTENELKDIHMYESFINSSNIHPTIKEKLKLTPPPKYDLYLQQKGNN